MRLIDVDKIEVNENAIFTGAAIKKFIDDIPAAYDACKVVERLKELKTYKLNMADAMSEIMRRGELRTYVCLEDVLEIVKSGGVTDE